MGRPSSGKRTEEQDLPLGAHDVRPLFRRSQVLRRRWPDRGLGLRTVFAESNPAAADRGARPPGAILLMTGRPHARGQRVPTPT